MAGLPGTRPAPDPPEGPRAALIIATTSYQDPELRQLRAPARDADDLAAVLGDPDIGAFTVTRMIDQDERQLRREIDAFLSGRDVSDLVVVYLSCHGVLDRRGRLYFAATDTLKTQLASTGIPSAWLLDQLDDCRARRQVLILDCCFSGAFAHGSKSGADLDLERRLAGPGRGRAVLTASRSGEYSFEGQALAGAPVAGSVFTTGLVEGLRSGAADLGGDGYVSLDEAYDYAYRYVQSRSASQTPQRWLYGGEGAIVLARSPAWAATTGVALEERKLATVLFADLAGSAELAADQDPERVRAILDRFYDAVTAEVERAGGTVGKFAGDAVMAVFGAPASHEDDAERALHAALGMQRRLLESSCGRLALRIGVNTGAVVAGEPRQGSSLATGDAVNVCALLERAAAPGEILVGERTVAAARGAFEFAESATAEAEGRPGGVGCCKLVRALSLVRPRGLGGLQPMFVGRTGEVEDLHQAYGRAVASGRPHLVTVVGDAGVGKTRLLGEFWRWLGGQSPQPVLRSGRCLSYGNGITYWPLGEVLKEHFGILDSDPPDVAAERVAGREGLGFTLGLSPPEDMHPLTVRERLHTSWVDFLQELAVERPTVVLVEDLHWADDELCDLLMMLADRVAGPLLLLATARPELLDQRPGWVHSPGASVIRLDALPSTEADQLIGALLGHDCPRPICDLVAERAEGNPFFVEELIGTLIDQGVLNRGSGGWSFGQLPPGFFMPDTVQAALAARIDLLPRAEKAALQTAAMIGRVFWEGPVRELVPGTDPDFGLLEERDFVYRHADSSIAGQREYVIKHALTREVAYKSLLKAKRGPLHAGFAQWLERNGTGQDEHAPLLAHHYAEAVRPEDLDLAWAGRGEQAERLRGKAIHWSRLAAELAIGRYEIDQGLVLLRRAAGLESRTSEQAEIWHRIGLACALKYDGERFWQAMQQALDIAGPSAEVYADLALQSVLRGGMWVQEPDWSLVDDWIQQALELAGEGSLAKAKAFTALADLNQDVSAARSALAIAERLGSAELRCRSLAIVSGIALGAKDFDRACAVMDQVIALLPGLPDPDVASQVLHSAVFAYLKSGKLDDAGRASVQAIETAAGLTPHHRLHAAGWQILLATLTGRWEEVRSRAAEAEQVVDANLAAATPCIMNASILLNCATASALAGEEDEGRRLKSKADGISMDGDRWYHGWIDPPKIRLALARHELSALPELAAHDLDWDWEPASTYLDALAALADRERIEAEAPRWLQPGTFSEPFALRALGIAREDPALLRQALALFQAMGLSWHADQTRHLL
jgi:class 3 adenylate cyclase